MIIENKSYIVWRMVLFSDGHGFILSKNVRSHDFYITLQFVQENGRPRCYRGGYHGDPQEAHQDFRQRVKDYQQKHGVRITRIYGMNIKHLHPY